MALYFVLFLGSTPMGAPIIGWIAEAIDPRAALATGGAATLIACAYGALRLPVEKAASQPVRERAFEIGTERLNPDLRVK